MSVDIFKPTKSLSRYVQGIWAADIHDSSLSDTKKYFVSDATSGFMLILQGAIEINGKRFEQGVVWQPTQKTAHAKVFSSNAKVVGFRFQPAVGTLVCNELPLSTCLLSPSLSQSLPKVQGLALQLCDLSDKLMTMTGQWQKITAVYRWLNHSIDFSQVIPHSIPDSIQAITPQRNIEQLPIGQRQLQRQFKRWLNMTPTYYKRLIRVHQSIVSLRNDVPKNLADFALIQGFSDQAHMTREFKMIANITPHQFIVKRVKID